MLRRALDGLYFVGALLAGACVVGIFLVMMAQIGLRQFGVPLAGADDLTAFLCVGAAFLALGYTFRRGELIRVGLGIERLRPGARRWAESAVLALGAAIVSYIVYWTANDVLFSYEINERAQGSVAFVLWLPKLAIPLGAGVLLVAMLDELVTTLSGGRPSYVAAAEERAARGDFSAEV